MPFIIRLATPEDSPALLAMNVAFNGETGVTEASIRRSLLHGAEMVVIAEQAGSPAGFCCAQVHRSFCYPSPVAEVTEMYVRENHRHQGCALQMLAFLETRLRQEGCDELHLLTGTRNHAAQAAYCRAGFHAISEQYMKKSLSDAAKTANSPT